MAERRMFSKSIVLSDAFLDMPMTARCLYFTLGMLADDDGFIGNPRSIMRQCGATEDDLKILLAKRFLLGFDSGVIVIKHWRMNNYLQNDRHKNTTYIEELKTLQFDEKGAYTENKNQCIQNVYEVYTQDSIDKHSIDKVSKDYINTCKYPEYHDIVSFAKANNIDYKFYFMFYKHLERQEWKLHNGEAVTNWKGLLLSNWNTYLQHQAEYEEKAKDDYIDSSELWFKEQWNKLKEQQ